MEMSKGSQTAKAGFVQLREWMLYKIREDHYPMNLMLEFNLDVFDDQLFQMTIDLLIKKYEIFRTTLHVMDRTLQQVIHEPNAFSVKFKYYDLSYMKEAPRELLIQERKLLLSNMPFNFQFGPLLRVVVFKKARDQYQIVWVFHHIIIDSYSAGIFEAEAIRIWNMLLNGGKEDLCDKTVGYRQYTEFENALVDTDLGYLHKEYWSKQLLQEIPRLLIITPEKWEVSYRQHLQKIHEVKKKVFSLPVHDERFIASVIRRYSGWLHWLRIFQ
jgi:Condensation domain